MSEFWKSTPKYWCKHCGVYVRDTKLERTNHEATGKHQSALKRFLRDLHRGHENEERDKDRAKREIERLNGLVGSSSGAAGSAGSVSSNAPTAGRIAPKAASGDVTAQRQKQWAQLALMGVDVPTELRPDMAMAGEWTVTNTKVIDTTPKTEADAKPEAIAIGVRKRVKREGEDDEDDAMHGLSKRPKLGGWGLDTRRVPDEEEDLDLLLGSLGPVKKQESEPVKKEKAELATSAVSAAIKKESSESENTGEKAVKLEPGLTDAVLVKEEEIATPEIEVPAVIFKKRKPKNIRQK
ncbi:uncharacterized protein BCR38DRAFT_441149 [Pseudomassariella vexata]|uniref:U1-C C2H2-type zinc finger domain-containing protein n=1 Tax=Pseudomassariella vexata TaxID=1141098 RepID=A0A1Y2DR77_9PEZI|nr:uncharacterized protein BCR38DRAFT_441149 [Pseudomassariella vexata]ORY61793.1 hypothetical protein BCR38DRAFT_441149 [Pseudomassariella vexata]